jgi:hypothetical protein
MIIEAMRASLTALTRRESFAAGAGLAGSFMPDMMAAAAATTALDFTTPKDNLYAFAKIWGTLGEEPVWGGHEGTFFAVMPGKRIVPLVGYVGCGSLQFKWTDTGGLAYRGKDATFYTDLKTGEILETWHNPWTGETCPVAPYIHEKVRTLLEPEWPDVVLSSDHYGFQTNVGFATQKGKVDIRGGAKRPYLLPWRQRGGYTLLAWDWAMEIDNPVTPEGWPKSSTGAIISPSEHFVFYTPTAELEDRARPWATMLAGFFRQTPWLPWMRMGQSGVAATLFARSHSHKITGTLDDVPRVVRARLERDYPHMLEPPTDWDMGPVGSTWGYYAKITPPENPDYRKPGS